MRYGIVIEQGDSNCSATVEETRDRIGQAIRIHLEGMRKDGDSIPTPTTVCDGIDVA